ncbi:MAG: bifunctional hydroxymethylpyrimidine kinase/phosphomethylpyrimidine kinase [Rikenellaceae bacterium]
MTDKREKIALTIAGSDSSAGAGIQADIKSAAALGVYMASVITALTAQNTVDVSMIKPTTLPMLRAQIKSIVTDLRVESVKTGMIPSAAMVTEIESCLHHYNLKKLVIDPVMISTSGATLIPKDAASKIIEFLFPLSEIITPNMVESSYITGVKIETAADFDKAAEKFEPLGVKYLLLKGGHLSGHSIVDILYNLHTGSQRIFEFPNIPTKNTHGTGCSLSSAIAASLSQGLTTEESTEVAEKFIHNAILSGKDYLYGTGHGPINHFYKLWNKKSEK